MKEIQTGKAISEINKNMYVCVSHVFQIDFHSFSFDECSKTHNKLIKIGNLVLYQMVILLSKHISAAQYDANAK